MNLRKNKYTDLWQKCSHEAIKYVYSLKVNDSWQFKISNIADEPVAVASATAALLLRFLNSLDLLSSEDKNEWLKYLNSFQNEDGLFVDEKDLCQTQEQPLWALLAHRTRHICWAIEALGGHLSKPINYVTPYANSEFIKRWLDELWNETWPGGIWAAGNWIMDIAIMLDMEYRHFNNQKAFEAIHGLIDELNKKQDIETGYWFDKNDDLRCAMAGSMHLYPIYWAYNRNVNFLDKIIDKTLALQQSDGLFDYNVGSGGSQCLDYDAIFILSNGYYLLPAKRKKIESCCQKVLNSIMVNHNSDGSFSDSRQNIIRHWATKAAIYNANGGSLWDTYARLMTIAMCIKIVTGYKPVHTNTKNLFEIWYGCR